MAFGLGFARGRVGCSLLALWLVVVVVVVFVCVAIFVCSLFHPFVAVVGVGC